MELFRNLPLRNAAGLVARLFALLLVTQFTLNAVGAQAPAADRTNEVALLPGDIIRIAVWREADLSGDFLVDELGNVILPLLGKVAVMGIPLPELRQKLIAAYTVQLRNPSVVITPLRRVYVLGEVLRPGPYLADPTVTLAGVIALAGGANAIGSFGRIRILRNGAAVANRVSAVETLASMNVHSGDQIFVDRRSWFDRNSTFVASAVLSVLTVAVTLLVR